MKDTVDVEGIRLLGETHTVVSDAEAKLCAASLQPLHISHTTFGETQGYSVPHASPDEA